ncbi:unnamed protein product [Bursaphelenchus xylophilus]|uniref:(pine wood nematode) hypothetical protein n=1 Tax=Bursaphelenchus xylophilus TaxID=6326 RepID=A0A1I7SRP3_BURXY|nr:unnamed protein product [Bursaphelenchus xylophilus]CAG9102043.1 unnamed protein product [Bursaphelenchus xylophilus]
MDKESLVSHVINLKRTRTKLSLLMHPDKVTNKNLVNQIFKMASQALELFSTLYHQKFGDLVARQRTKAWLTLSEVLPDTSPNPGGVDPQKKACCEKNWNKLMKNKD